MQVNKQPVALPYKKYGLRVYESGINYVVDIPELGALVSYNGLSFSIRLPYRLFGNNTKGQCGEPGALPSPLPGAPPPPACAWPPWEARGRPVPFAPLALVSWPAGHLGWSRGGVPERPGSAPPTAGSPGTPRPHRHVHQHHRGRLRAAQRGGRLQLRGRR